MAALRIVALATAQVLRMVADVLDPEPAYGEPTRRAGAADVTGPQRVVLVVGDEAFEWESQGADHG